MRTVDTGAPDRLLTRDQFLAEVKKVPTRSDITFYVNEIPDARTFQQWILTVQVITALVYQGTLDGPNNTIRIRTV